MPFRVSYKTVILTFIVSCLLKCTLVKCRSEERPCENVDVRNHISNLDKIKDCEVITGYLQIVLVERNRNPADFVNITFPKLREITGYLMMYRFFGIESLHRLFPNLTVIRGQNLFLHHSLIIVEMRHLKSVGLTNLVAVQRGFVYIRDCPVLCHLSWIDWDALTTSIDRTKSSPNVIQSDSISCPALESEANRCVGCHNNHCWHNRACQRIDGVIEADKKTYLNQTCHKECLAGCFNETNRGCKICRNLTMGNECVSQCTNNTVLHKQSLRCLTKMQCAAQKRVIYENECMDRCPPRFAAISSEVNEQAITECISCMSGCPKHCPGMEIKYLTDSEKFRGCTIIDGSVHIRMNIDLPNMEEELERNLGDIEEIEGNLKVFRSVSITTLSFLRSLNVIHGKLLENDKFALVVYDVPNLRTLWDWKLKKEIKISEGSILFHLNNDLCMVEINRLKSILKYNNVNDYTPANTNGFKHICDETSKLIIFSYVLTGYVTTIRWEKFDDYNHDFDYILYYIQTSGTNMTPHYGRDTCTKFSWKSVYIPANSLKVNNGFYRYNLTDLKPNALYGFYIRTYTSHKVFQNYTQGQSEIMYFKTRRATPKMPFMHTEKKTYDSITIKITLAPDQHNLIDYFRFGYYKLSDNLQLISETRDFCDEPQTSYVPEESHIKPMDCCDQIHTDDADEDFAKHSLGNEDQFKKCDFDSSTTDCQLLTEITKHKREADYTRLTYREYMDLQFALGLYEYVELKVQPKDFRFSGHLHERKSVSWETMDQTIEELDPFSLYFFMVSACNTECSPVYVYSERTRPIPENDNVDFTVQNTTTSLIIRFVPPNTPNGLTVAYVIEYLKLDQKYAKEQYICVSSKSHEINNYTVVVGVLSSGPYSVRVRTHSLGGVGKFTESKYVEIRDVDPEGLGPPDSNNIDEDTSKPDSVYGESWQNVHTLVIVVVAFAFIFGIVFFVRWLYQRRRHSPRAYHLPEAQEDARRLMGEGAVNRPVVDDDRDVYWRRDQGEQVSIGPPTNIITLSGSRNPSIRSQSSQSPVSRQSTRSPGIPPLSSGIIERPNRSPSKSPNKSPSKSPSRSPSKFLCPPGHRITSEHVIAEEYELESIAAGNVTDENPGPSTSD